ncbi:carbamoyltransferase HypF [Candidatus Dependentiae bacterium]|nr:carbamoyltransferase HypF [Candidatus Dependentiae bacterium]
MKRNRIRITGIVQGVGFRPFIYNLAKSFAFTGWVFNDSSGVEVEVQGSVADLEKFRKDLRIKKPSISVIETLDNIDISIIKNEEGFIIKHSKREPGQFVLISPDLAICNDCRAELFNKQDRRYFYPFINCTNCGPRFTIIKDIPYDRGNTTMLPFKMCNICQAEYEDPGDRRFHAQPDACFDCGPGLTLLSSDGTEKHTDNIINETIQLLQSEKVIAIKGLGGYHLACDALCDAAVSKLRSRKYREEKPFAVMFPSITRVKEFCEVNREEENLLTGNVRPIVLLKKKPGTKLPETVAPKQKYLGVMLPYTPLHYILLTEFNGPLVMTSGNISDEPISFLDNEAKHRLKDIADYFLLHNREIFMRCDDSVSRIFNGKEYPLRRARGYVPFPIILPGQSDISVLGCGGMLKNTFCLTLNNYAFISHHIGDLENLETYKSFEDGIEHFKRLFSITPELIVSDLHPEYLSTQYALDSPIKNKLAVQHHYAHVLSCMADNKLSNEKVIGVACDGTGYGDDGNIWGGEILIADYNGFERFGHIDYFDLPGGDSAIINPYKTAISLLLKSGISDDVILTKLFPDLKSEFKIIKNMISKELNTVKTSSLGRLFDGVSSIIGVKRKINYEGQAAIELEMIADEDDTGQYPFDLKKDVGTQLLLIEQIIIGVVNDLLNGMSKNRISSKFHNTIVEIFAKGILEARNYSNINQVALSGGVFQNMIFLKKLIIKLKSCNFNVIIHDNVPCNDGGISLGQAVFGIFNS